MDHPSGLHITLAAERLGSFLGLPITNTLIAGWFVMLVLLTIAFFGGRRVSLLPGKLQNFFEYVFEFAINYMENILGSRELAVRYFPLIATIFLVIATSNLFDFFPFFGSITYHVGEESVPLLRPVNTDLNVTLALAIIAVIAIEIIGIMALGVRRYASKFFNFSSPVNFIVGLIELVSELSRFISFSFRLFGNIFAGEVLIAVIVFFVPYILPVPLMVFETFIGIVQATVFAMLTLFFIKLARTPAHGEAH
jgi:F-type H+-transporting ATPase subunit a